MIYHVVESEEKDHQGPRYSPPKKLVNVWVKYLQQFGNHHVGWISFQHQHDGTKVLLEISLCAFLFGQTFATQFSRYQEILPNQTRHIFCSLKNHNECRNICIKNDRRCNQVPTIKYFRAFRYWDLHSFFWSELQHKHQTESHVTYFLSFHNADFHISGRIFIISLWKRELFSLLKLPEKTIYKQSFVTNSPLKKLVIQQIRNLHHVSFLDICSIGNEGSSSHLCLAGG